MLPLSFNFKNNFVYKVCPKKEAISFWDVRNSKNALNSDSSIAKIIKILSNF